MTWPLGVTIPAGTLVSTTPSNTKQRAPVTSVTGCRGGTTDDCFDSNNKPDPLSGCDFYTLTVNTPGGFSNK